MSNFRSNAPQPAYRHNLRLETACSFEAVREAAQFARAWLAEQRVAEEELSAWELALVEAGNNAVEYVTEDKRALPIVIELSVGESEVEVRITDHTPGFDLPESVDLPDLDSEGGRGVFLIKSLTDSAAYLRSRNENQLILRKRRATSGALPEADVNGLQGRLAESEQAVGELSEELASSYESLVAMFRYSAELGKSADLRDFASRLLADILQLTETDVAVLRLVHQKTLETFLILPDDLQSRVATLGETTVSQSVEWEALKTREDVWFDAVNPLRAGDPLRAIAGIRAGLVHVVSSGDQPLGTLTIIRCRKDNPLRSAQANILHTFVDFLAIQIVNARLLDERTQSRITRRELEIAANIQRSLLPVSVPNVPPFSIAASCTNAREVGGDFYDVLRVGEEGLLVLIADVMGKGVPAALFAAVLRSAVRSMPALYTEPAALLTSVNRTLCDDLSRVDMFVTAKAVFLDVKQQRIVSASAGHCPLLLCRPNQCVAEFADDADLPLGIDFAVEYQQTITPFLPGAVALLFTDGLSELQNPTGKMFDIESLEKFLPQLSPIKVPAANMSNTLQRELDAFRAGAALTDDQTFVILRHEL